MPLDTFSPTATLPPAVLDALRQATALSEEARGREAGDVPLDARAQAQLSRMAALLPAGAVTLPPPSARAGLPPPYTRDEGDLRAILRACPSGWTIGFEPTPLIGWGLCWAATLRAPDGSRHRFTARSINAAGLRAVLAAVAGLLLDTAAH